MKSLVLAAAAVLSCTPSFAQWSSGTLSQARADPAATTVGPYALFAGGHFSSVVDLYDSRTGTWSAASVFPDAYDRYGASAGDCAVFLGTQSATADVFDAATAAWSTSSAPLVMGEGVATGAARKVYFAQGGAAAAESDLVGIYDTASGTWSTDVLSQARFGLAATSVGGLVLFAGGAFSVTTVIPVSTVDILDTQTNTWSTASLSEARRNLAAISIGTKAMFAGGGPAYTDRVDIYDSATGTWSQASLSERRADLSATTVGRFAIFAGGNPGYSIGSDRVDIYDSVLGTWNTATLSQARRRLSATSVGGLAFFACGEPAQLQYSDVLDIFDPRLGMVYCVPANANSTGFAARLRAEGYPRVAFDDVTLIAEQLPPGQFGYFIAGLTQGLIQPPGSQGPICLSGNIGRYNRPSQIIQGPVGSLRLDLTSMPVNPPLAALPGDTWNFQCWYRDVNPGPTSNTTNGLAVAFAPATTPSVQFDVTQAAVIEQIPSIEVRLTLSEMTNQDVPVTWATGGTATLNVDWRVGELNPFVIPAGHTWANMTLLIADDDVQEPLETATVTLTSATGAVVGGQATFTLSIFDND